MSPVDKRLVIRVAARMEQAALEKYEAALKGTPDRVDEARRTRDRELGDVLDLRTYVERAESDAADAARFRFLNSGPETLGTKARIICEAWGALNPGKPMTAADFERSVDSAIATAGDAKLRTEG